MLILIIGGACPKAESQERQATAVARVKLSIIQIRFHVKHVKCFT